MSRSNGAIDTEHFRTLIVENACERAEEKLLSSWFPRVTALFTDPNGVIAKHKPPRSQSARFYECVDALIGNQLREMLMATIQHYVALYREDDTTCLPQFKLDLCLEGRSMEFFPSLSELEGAIVCLVETVANAMSNVPSIGVRVCIIQIHFRF